MAQIGQFLRNHLWVWVPVRESSTPLLLYFVEARVTVQSPRRQVEEFLNLGGNGLGGRVTCMTAIRVSHLEGEKGGKPSSVSK